MIACTRNVRGYPLMAAGFYQALKHAGWLPAEPDTALIIRSDDAPLTELDIAYAGHKIANLLRQYPFNQTNSAAPTLSDSNLAPLLQQRLNGEPWLVIQRQS